MHVLLSSFAYFWLFNFTLTIFNIHRVFILFFESVASKTHPSKLNTIAHPLSSMNTYFMIIPFDFIVQINTDQIVAEQYNGVIFNMLTTLLQL